MAKLSPQPWLTEGLLNQGEKRIITEKCDEGRVEQSGNRAGGLSLGGGGIGGASVHHTFLP